ncbi:RNA helicase [Exophiala dermatitidis]|nr:RNA helicase [Exophiala dermatitidis]KAJ4565914.1 RNA helicase [Exophiala dermatitidis]KAJ4591134.1 RNA helicase [Exophiala dermatitidis]KAJ4609425.1 RNA helicase [Exophiala dermatitidis]KAJ4667077.1 RNA helicase [Exophiala dermatitidis]
MLPISTRRGQCLLCSIRTLLAASPKRAHDPRRRFTNNATLLGPRDRFPSSRRKGDSGRDSKSSSKPNRRSGPVAAKLSPETIQNRLLTGLESLKKRLSSTKVDDESEVTQLAALDPDHKYWPGFKRKLEGVVTGENKTAEDDRLLAEIGHTQNSSDWRADLERVLHFSFIDYVLQKKAEQDPGNLKSVRPDLRYPTEWYTPARQIQRDVHLHIGPTNSGKTYNALKRLEESGSGFYAGPLRLLAHEVFSRFKAKGMACDLVTGDDVRLDDNEDVTLSASTVEMVDVTTPVEVAVIDEVQMMASEDRGWAWTRAFLGANAKEVHLCGEARVLPLIRELTASTGDSLHVHEYKRLNPLKVMAKSLGGNLKNLRKGDCIVTFSVFSLHAMKKQIELDTGRRCAIVYGSLPPETRAQQAALFNDPDNDYDYLVASDAIGMGLNLSVKRIIFHGTLKFNGSYTEQLTVPQIKQIGGRAGRYRSSHQAMNNSSNKSDTATEANVGLVTTLNDEDLPIVRDAMNAEDPPIRYAGLLPPGDFLEDMATRLPKGIPFEYILQRLRRSASIHRRFKLCSIRDQSRIARIIEPVRGLTTAQRIVLTAAPGHSASSEVTLAMKALARVIAEQRQVTVVDVPEINLEILEKPISGDREYLQSLEDLHKVLILFLWLSYRFIGTFKDRDMATYAKEMVEDRINTCLREFSANPELRKRVLSYKKRMDFPKIPTTHEFGGLNLDFPDSQESALPVDWTRGPEDSEFQNARSQQSAVTAHG